MGKVFVGQDWCSLTEALAEEIQKRRSGAEPKLLNILVPSQSAKFWVLSQLAVLLDNDLAGVGVYSLHQFALNLFDRLGSLSPKVIEDKRYISLVWQIIKEKDSGWSFPQRDPYPTARALYSLIRKLRDAGITKEESAWLSLEEPYEGLGLLECQKARKIFALYTIYLETLEKRDWIDSPKMMELAAKVLESAADAIFAEPVFIWGFYDFVGVQKNFLRVLARRAEVDFFLPEGDLTKPLIDEIVGWGSQRVQISSERAAPALPADRHRSTVFSVPEPSLEAWAIAHKIMSLVDTKGAAFKDCAVIFRNSEDFIFLKKSFLKEDIPFVCFDDPMENLASKPLGAALERAISFLEKPSAKRYVDLLASPMAQLAPHLKIDVLNILTRVLSLKREKLLSFAASDAIEEIINDVIKNESIKVKELKSEVAQEVIRLTKLFCLALEVRSCPSAQSLIAWLNHALVAPEDPDLSCVYESLKLLIASLPEEVFSSMPVLARLILETSKSSALDHPRAAEKTSGVWLLSANAARGARHDFVFIFGAADGNYPLEAAENPFLSDPVCQRLNRLGHALSESLKSNQEDALLFRLLSSSAAKELFISWSQVDAQGKPKMASPFINREADFAFNGGMVAEQFEFLNAFAPNPNIRLDFKESMDGTKCQPFVAQMKPADWQERLVGLGALSPTALADYLSCPQAFFFKRVVSLPEYKRENRFELLSAPRLGNLLSRVMIEFLKTGGKTLPSVWQERLAEELSLVSSSDLAANERYKLKRVQKTLQRVESLVGSIIGGQAAPDIGGEKNIEFTLPGIAGRLLKARVDGHAQDRFYLEFKLTAKSVFGVKGTRLKPSEMLAKLLRSDSVEGPRYGLQILYYWLHAKLFKSQAPTILINPHWAIDASKDYPFVYSWDQDQDLDDAVGKFLHWISFYSEGLTAGRAAQVVFPFWPHENIGGRCQYCSYQFVCQKDVPKARLAHEKLSQTLRRSFNSDENDN